MNRRKTILLVEDNQDDVDLTLAAFDQAEVRTEIVVARDGVEALAYLLDAENDGRAAASRPLPELVLLDLNLPKVDGLQVLQRIRADERTRHLPVVVLTSSKADEDVLRSYRSGANSFVRKPVDFGQFMEATRQLGVYWLTINEPAPEPRS